jgi:tetratricopeptide (TPR) repeat protein
MGRNDHAYDYFKQALELDAEKYNSLIGMGAISLDRGEVEEAL